MVAYRAYIAACFAFIRILITALVKSKTEILKMGGRPLHFISQEGLEIMNNKFTSALQYLHISMEISPSKHAPGRTNGYKSINSYYFR